MYRMRLAGTTILYSKGPEAKGAKELEIRYTPPLALSLAVPSSSNDNVIPYTSRILHVIPSLLTPINRHLSSPLHINPVPISIEMSSEHN